VRPIPPEAARFTAQARGFEHAEIMRLRPYSAEMQLKEGAQEMRDKLNSMLFSAQDYSIVAYKAPG
jgi:hypothetical protein